MKADITLHVTTKKRGFDKLVEAIDKFFESYNIEAKAQNNVNISIKKEYGKICITPVGSSKIGLKRKAYEYPRGILLHSGANSIIIGIDGTEYKLNYEKKNNS